VSTASKAAPGIFFRSSKAASFHLGSGTPETNQLDPLSASNIP
jgi:hypothetical protein